jgi:hypothetical protein
MRLQGMPFVPDWWTLLNIIFRGKAGRKSLFLLLGNDRPEKMKA